MASSQEQQHAGSYTHGHKSGGKYYHALASKDEPLLQQGRHEAAPRSPSRSSSRRHEDGARHNSSNSSSNEGGASWPPPPPRHHSEHSLLQQAPPPATMTASASPSTEAAESAAAAAAAAAAAGSSWVEGVEEAVAVVITGWRPRIRKVQAGVPPRRHRRPHRAGKLVRVIAEDGAGGALQVRLEDEALLWEGSEQQEWAFAGSSTCSACSGLAACGPPVQRRFEEFSRGMLRFDHVVGVQWTDDAASADELGGGGGDGGALEVLAWRTTRSNPNTYALWSLRLQSARREVLARWKRAIEAGVARVQPQRPRRLLVVVNPVGGKKQAVAIFRTFVAPLMESGGVEMEVLYTQHAGHARDTIAGADARTIAEWDGIVVVGGDGMLNEVVEGLAANATEPLHKPRGSRIRIGVVPAGSTDTVCYSLHGCRDATTAVLHIIAGDRLPVDVTVVESQQRVKQVLSFCAFGFYGNIISISEKFRWMGPSRYDVAGALALFKHDQYRLRIAIQTASGSGSGTRSSSTTTTTTTTPVSTITNGKHYTTNSNRDANGRDSQRAPTATEVATAVASEPIVCRSGPRLDQLAAEAKAANVSGRPCVPEHKLFASDGLSTAAGDDGKALTAPLAAAAAAAAAAGDDTSGGDNNDDDDEGSGGLEVLLAVLCSFVCWCLGLRLCAALSCFFLGRRVGEMERWRLLQGDFHAAACAVLSCRCDKAQAGLAKHAQLCDGLMDLFLVRECTRLQYLQYLLAIAWGKDPLVFPFVEHHKVQAARFYPEQPQGHWNLDGELVSQEDCHPVTAHVERGYVCMFGRGPAE